MHVSKIVAHAPARRAAHTLAATAAAEYLRPSRFCHYVTGKPFFNNYATVTHIFGRRKLGCGVRILGQRLIAGHWAPKHMHQGGRTR